MAKQSSPLPLFDTLSNVADLQEPDLTAEPSFCRKDYQHALAFLISYDGSEATFNAYRREVERLLHWAWQIAKKSICDLRRADLEAYFQFCQKPPENWISLKKVPRFLNGVARTSPINLTDTNTNAIFG